MAIHLKKMGIIFLGTERLLRPVIMNDFLEQNCIQIALNTGLNGFDADWSEHSPS